MKILFFKDFAIDMGFDVKVILRGMMDNKLVIYQVL